MKITRRQLETIIEGVIVEALAQKVDMERRSFEDDQTPEVFDSNQDGKVDYDELSRLMGSISGDLKDMGVPELQLLSMKIDKLIAQL